jgi:hypothetical protein
MMEAIAPRLRGNSAVLAAVLAGLFFSLMPFLWRNRTLSDANIALAIALAWIALIPAFLHLRRIDSEPMPFAALMGFYYLVFFALPVLLFEPSHWQSVRYPDGRSYGLEAVHFSERAQLLLIAGLASLLVSYYAARRSLDRLPLRLRLPRHFAPGRLRSLAWMVVAAHFAWIASPWLRHVPSLGLWLQWVTPAAIGLLLVSRWRRQITRTETALLFLGVLPAYFAIVVASGLSTGLLLMTLYLTILMYRFKPRLFWGPPLICVAFMLFLYPALASFRAISWSDAAYSLAERVVMPIEIAYGRWFAERQDAGDPLRPIVRRVSIGAVTLSDVVGRTPGEIPLLHGESYRPLLTGFVPRIFWRGKPEERFGQVFGHRYRYLAPDDRATSWSTPWIVEAYANFGGAGGVLAMSLIGVFLAFASRLLNAAEMSWSEFTIGAALLLPLFYQGVQSLRHGVQPSDDHRHRLAVLLGGLAHRICRADAASGRASGIAGTGLGHRRVAPHITM